MKKKAMPMVFAIAVIAIAIVVLLVNNSIGNKAPSKKHISKENLYKMFRLYDGYTMNGDEIDFSGATMADEKQIAVVLQGNLVNDRGILEDGHIYVDYQLVKRELNKRFYWDNNENILIYTTPKDVIRADVGSAEYYETKVKKAFDHTIVKANGSYVYVSLDFVKQFSNLEYSVYENQNRLCITNSFGVDVKVANTKKDAVIRSSNSIHSDVVKLPKAGEEVIVLEEGKKWYKVCAKDGYFGYIEKSNLKKIKTKKYQSDFVEPEYTNISKEGTVSLGWHMVTTKASNNQLVDLVTSAKGLDVVAPTWFRLSDNEGNMTSYAESNYVEKAHLVGLEVWAVVDDQSADSDNRQIFTYTSKREKIINQLIATAIEYNIDGINVDFEYIAPEIADDYIQFIRELSVKCRINGIVLSVDNKVPEVSNFYYNIQEQGEIVDYVIMMGYDEHWGVDSGAGSTASLPWVTEGIENMVSRVPAEKVICGIPFYTRIWEEDKDGNVVGCTSVSMDTAIKNLQSHGVEPTWVDNQGQYYGEYTEGDKTIRIWIENEKSLEEKLKLIGTHKLAGVAAWRLGLESDSTWNTIIKYTH